jgi:hypothetical protein
MLLKKFCRLFDFPSTIRQSEFREGTLLPVFLFATVPAHCSTSTCDPCFRVANTNGMVGTKGESLSTEADKLSYKTDRSRETNERFG